MQAKIPDSMVAVFKVSFCYRSALHYAARYEKTDILKKLLAHNASALAENSDGM